MSLITQKINLVKLCTRKNIENVLYMTYRTNVGYSEKHGNDYKKKFNNNKNYVKYIGIGTSLTALIFYAYNEKRKRPVYLASPSLEKSAGLFREDLPNYTIDDVIKHSNKKTRVWVTYKRGVYDITDFISQHPGGDQIMMAAGTSLEPFWLLYGIHKTNQVFTMLEEMRIGNVSEEASTQALRNMEDPYANEPKRHGIIKAHTEKPFNGEPPASLLVENFLTPNEIFYVRNHLPVPEVDPETYELEVEIDGGSKIKTFSLKDIKKLPKYTIPSTIMCAGNRRSEMDKVKEVKGLSWGSSSIGNATWTGARLVDVLKMMGIDEDTEGFGHVHFEGLDMDSTSHPYSVSIPFAKAVDKKGDVLLAYEMNGKPIPRDHGFPIRAVVPGTVGARNCKWLARIVVSKEECDSHWQGHDYKGVSPSANPSEIDLTKLSSIQELPVISAICKPSEGDVVKVEDGHITVKGYAWSGGGRKIIRVDVTIDGGKQWHVANFDHQDKAEPPRHWSWSLWTAKIPVPTKSKTVEIWAKAIDSSYNTQPDTVDNIWNFRGFLNNAYHRVKINLKT